MTIKRLVIPLTALALAISAPAMAKKPEGKGNPHGNVPDARHINSNKQSDEFSTRGRERAAERDELKKDKEHKKKFKEKKQKYWDESHNRHDDYDGHDRYKHRRYDDDDDHKNRYKRQYEEERNGMDRRRDVRQHEGNKKTTGSIRTA